eukprot:15466817-Alexandrium_andersonii.AAC.1
MFVLVPGSLLSPNNSGQAVTRARLPEADAPEKEAKPPPQRLFRARPGRYPDGRSTVRPGCLHRIGAPRSRTPTCPVSALSPMVRRPS